MQAGQGRTAWMAALALLAGTAAQLQQQALWPQAAYAALCAAAVMLACVAWGLRRRPAALALLGAMAALLLGFGATGWRAAERLGQALPAAVEGLDLQVVGVVASLPQFHADGVRFRFEMESASHGGQPVAVPPLVSLGWYAPQRGSSLQGLPQATLRAGQRWRFTVRLRQPHGNLNPHGFDYELWLFEQGIRATGYVRDNRGAAPERLDEQAGHRLDRWRQQVRDAIERRVADPHAAGVLAALAIGDQGAIERDDWEVFRNTGVAHLMSISGLHVTMFAWLAGGLAAWCWRRSTRLALRLPAATAGRWIGLAAAIVYALLSGWGVPAQRTVCMLAVVTAAGSLGRRWPWPLVWGMSAVAVTLADPWALLQPGFWLSFAAVGLLLASGGADTPAGETPAVEGASRRQRWAAAALRAAHGGLRTQVIATVGLAPLTLVFFQQVSLIGFAANLLAIPLVTLAVTPLALAGALMSPLWSFGAVLVQWLGGVLAWLAAWPWATWTVPAAPLWAMVSGLGAAVLLVAPLPWRLRLLAGPLLLPLLAPTVPRPAPGSFDLLAADVGQGTAVLVRTAGHTLLYDTGPQYSRESDAGERVLVPLLRGLGEARLDRLMLSHRDTDHVGGAASLLQAVGAASLWSSLEDAHPLRAAGVPATRCEAGQRWVWDGVGFEVLHPRPADYARAGLKPNGLSCVLRVSTQQASALLAGDIEREQEAALVASGREALRSDLLLVPHHGSKTSSTDAFLDAVMPHTAVVQAGYRNRFGHPAAEVLARYRARGIRVVQSASCGAWQWPAERQGCWRDAVRRYWHHEAQAFDAADDEGAP
jgi:competence protein ComEC